MILYTKTICPKCLSIKSMLKNSGIEFQEINVDEDPSVAEMLREKGFMAAPIMYHEENFVLSVAEMMSIVSDLTA